MKIIDQLKITGSLVIEVINESGIVTKRLTVPNTVVTTGKQYIASRIVGTATSVMSHMAIGTGSALPDIGQTTLSSQLTIVPFSVGGSFTSSTNVVTATANFPSGTAGAIVEAGIFNNSVNGIMLCRTTFPQVNKGINDAISISWSITVS